MTEISTLPARPWRRRWRWGGTLVVIAALVWVLRGVDLHRLLAIVVGADVRFLALVPIAFAAGELVRAWKWRQLLSPLVSVGTLRLFGAIMAGYLIDLLLPLGLGPFVRSWLVARLSRLEMGAILATVAVDRLIDGLTFVVFVGVVLSLVAFPDPSGDIRLGLISGAAASLVVFPLLLALLAQFKRQAVRAGGWPFRLLDYLPPRFVAPTGRLIRSIADGVIWPLTWWRRLGIVLASLGFRLIAATHFLWAGLALGTVLRPVEYIFLMVFLGFVIVLTRFLHLAGGFVIGAVFALGLFGVPKEQALAMTVIVVGANLLTIASIGAVFLWREGIALGDLRPLGHGNGACT